MNLTHIHYPVLNLKILPFVKKENAYNDVSPKIYLFRGTAVQETCTEFLSCEWICIKIRTGPCTALKITLLVGNFLKF